MTDNMLMIALFVGVLVCLIALLIPDSQSSKVETKTKKQTEKGDVLISWLSPNRMSIASKITIVTLFSMLLLPRFSSFASQPHLFKMDLYSLRAYFNTLSIEFKPFNTWTDVDLLFIIGYVGILVLLVNIPVRYVVMTGGISYRILGFEISFYAWEEMVCFDMKSHSNALLMIWFDPAMSQPDWRISIPKEQVSDTSTILQDFIFNYSLAKHERVKPKVFGLK